VADRGRWDSAVKALDGSVLQSWAWGEWYREGGYVVERVRVDGTDGTGLAQLLIWPHGDPPVEAHLPWGPILAGDRAAAARELFAALDDICEPHRPLVLTVEPPEPLPLADLPEAAGFAPAPGRWCCNGRTVVVPLLDDESLLRRMRSKTRQQVRQLARRGVMIDQVPPDAVTLAAFYALLEETARRNEFPIEPVSYYEDFLRHLGEAAVLLVARTEEGLAAGLIITCFGREGIAHFGASSTELRVPGATAALYFTAMQLARSRGCTRFDLWGIPDADPPEVVGEQPEGSRGGDWQGIQHFKLGLGGDIVTYPPSLVRHYPARRRWAFWRR
jgi:lipid II:glycine glycyltransferase (peptidoglycan interpeptide bridge formation enzyme)